MERAGTTAGEVAVGVPGETVITSDGVAGAEDKTFVEIIGIEKTQSELLAGLLMVCGLWKGVESVQWTVLCFPFSHHEDDHGQDPRRRALPPTRGGKKGPSGSGDPPPVHDGKG